MKISTVTRLLLLSLALVLALSSCSFINEMKDEAEKVSEFADDFAALVQDPTPEKAESLVHPASRLTPEDVIEKIQSNEKLASLDTSGEVSVENISDIKMSYHDEELGGNVYTVECDVVIGGVTINASITLLSTSEGFGLYDFEIK